MIRYDDKFNKELIRSVRNFNAKLRRLEKAGVEVPVEKASLRSIRKEFTERSDLESYIKELHRFSQRGVEEIVYIDRYGKKYTQFDINVGAMRQSRAIKLAKRKIAEASKVKRTELGEKEIQSLMGTDYVNNLKANLAKLQEYRFTKRLSKAQQSTLLRAAKRVIGTKHYNARIRQNFYAQMETLAKFAHFPMAKVSAARSLLDALNPRQFELARNGEEVIVAIEEIYPRLKEVKTAEEKQALAQQVNLYLDALFNAAPEIVKYYKAL